jgi:hypothetical protein
VLALNLSMTIAVFISSMQPSPFFTDQLTAFEVWLEHGSEWKKPPEQLPIVLQVLDFSCSSHPGNLNFI